MTDVRGTIRFLKDAPLYRVEKPYRLILPADVRPDFKTNNLAYHEKEDIVIRNIRPNESFFKLDTHGFQVGKHQTELTSINSEREIEAYKRETEKFLEQTFAAEYVLCWDVLMREVKQSKRQAMDIRDRLSFHVPVLHAHTDETDASGHDSLDLRLGKELRERYDTERYQLRMINTWRSLTPSLEDHPLAVLDCTSMDMPTDLIASDQIVPSRAAEIYHLLSRSGHRWYWLAKQQCDELLLFVQFNTDISSPARFCPHAAFINHDAPEGAARRRSVETRSIVITAKNR